MVRLENVSVLSPRKSLKAHLIPSLHSSKTSCCKGTELPFDLRDTWNIHGAGIYTSHSRDEKMNARHGNASKLF